MLDRAVVIDMSDIDIEGYLSALKARTPELDGAIDQTMARLVAVHGQLAKHGLGFGYRVADEVVRYWEVRAGARRRVLGRRDI